MKRQRKRYEKITKKIIKIFSVILIIGFVVDTVSAEGKVDVKKRSVEVLPICESDKYTSDFEKSDVFYNEDSEIVKMVATDKYINDDKILFDNVSLEENYDEETEQILLTNQDTEEIYNDKETEDDSPDVDFADDIGINQKKLDAEYEIAEINYECSFDMNDLVFNFTAALVDEEGTVIDTKEIVTDAIITETGGLDACIVIDGKEYMMSDYEDSSSIDNCSIGSVIKVVDAYLAVAETAEKVKAKSNYKYNKQLENDGKGVGKGYYVFDQTNTTTKNRKAGNYRFGFTKFKNVGCEVAAAYNMVLALGDSERLSQTIYYFEAWAIEFAIGWGCLGSDPLEIYRYLKKRGYSYEKYTSFSSLSTAVSKKSNCKIIMSRWNSKKTDGLHTFFVNKSSKNCFYGYNWRYKNSSEKKTSLSSFNDGSGFIVGYIVWK